MPDLPVSIVIPAYNARHLIANAIDSCLAQTYDEYEIIVVDDGSTDDTAAFIQATYGDAVHVLSQHNQGVSWARYNGTKAANHEFVKFLDADDVMHPTHLEQVMQRFEDASDTLGVVYTAYIMVAGDTRTPKHMAMDGDIFCDLLKSNGINGILPSTVTVKKTIYLELAQPQNAPEVAEDWYVFLHIAAHYRFALVPDPLLDYQRHDKNHSYDVFKAARGRLHVLQHINGNPRISDCMSHADFNTMLAARYHQLSMMTWRLKQHRLTREYLQRAIQLTPDGRRTRQVYVLLSYVVSFQVIHRINALLERR